MKNSQRLLRSCSTTSLTTRYGSYEAPQLFGRTDRRLPVRDPRATAQTTTQRSSRRATLAGNARAKTTVAALEEGREEEERTRR